MTALAQLSQRPFAVAGGEGGGGGEGGLTGWLMAEQSSLTHLIAGKVHALHGQPSAAWGLVGLGLAYGVVHAAGPGHGKAVLASYMLANERSLKRGAVMALMAALLQALIAIALVGAAGFVFRATASQMNQAADWIDLASYCSVAAIGAWLVWRKGGALIAALSRARGSPPRIGFRPGLRRRRMAAAGIQPFGGGLSRRAARRAWRTGGRVRTHAHARSGSAQWTVFLARRGRNGDRRGRASVLGRDPGAGFRHGARAIRRRSCRRLRHGDRHGGDDGSARLDGRLRQVGRDAARGGGKFAPCAGGEGIRIRRRPGGAGVRRRAIGRRARRPPEGRRESEQKSRREGGLSFPAYDARYAATAAALREAR